MTVLRSLVGTVGVVLALVLLVLGVVLAPVLLLLAPFAVLFVVGWRFWRLKRRVGRGVKRTRRRTRRWRDQVSRGMRLHR